MAPGLQFALIPNSSCKTRRSMCTGKKTVPAPGMRPLKSRTDHHQAPKDCQSCMEEEEKEKKLCQCFRPQRPSFTFTYILQHDLGANRVCKRLRVRMQFWGNRFSMGKWVGGWAAHTKSTLDIDPLVPHYVDLLNLQADRHTNNPLWPMQTIRAIAAAVHRPLSFFCFFFFFPTFMINWRVLVSASITGQHQLTSKCLLFFPTYILFYMDIYLSLPARKKSLRHIFRQLASY